MGDTELFGQFANEAFNYDLSVGDPIKFAVNYTVIATSHGNWSGYDGFAAFNPKDCKVVVANVGTDTDQIMDLVADYLLATKGVNIQLGDSIALTKVAVTAASRALQRTIGAPARTRPPPDAAATAHAKPTPTEAAYKRPPPPPGLPSTAPKPARHLPR